VSDGIVIRRLFFVKQDAHARRFDILELSGSDRPHKCSYACSSENQGQGYEEIEYVHVVARCPRNVRCRIEERTTMNELMGMATAANRGVTRPASAATPPATL